MRSCERSLCFIYGDKSKWSWSQPILILHTLSSILICLNSSKKRIRGASRDVTAVCFDSSAVEGVDLVGPQSSSRNRPISVSFTHCEPRGFDNLDEDTHT